MEAHLLQRNSDPLLAQLMRDDYSARQLSAAMKGDGTKTAGGVSNSDNRETQVYVVPSSKSDTPALIVWSRPLTSRKRLSSSTCTLGPEELLGVSAAKRALNGASPWSDGREQFDLDSAVAAADAAAAAAVAAASAAAAGASPSAGGSAGSPGGAAASAGASADDSSASPTGVGNSKSSASSSSITSQHQQQQKHLSLAVIGPESPAAAKGRLQSVYSRYSEKQAYKRLLKVLKRHPYLDREAIKYNKLLLLESSLNICHRFQASLRSVGGVGPGGYQRLESLEDLAVEESHLVSAIREHVAEIPYLATFAPRSDRRAGKIEARVRRMERQADSCAGCHAMLCAHCLSAAAAASSAAAAAAASSKSAKTKKK